MSDSLGLSIGMTNLVAARMGRPPVMRRSVLTVFDDRDAEVGVPSENPNLNQPGMVLSGFTAAAIATSPIRGDECRPLPRDDGDRYVGPLRLVVEPRTGFADRRRKQVWVLRRQEVGENCTG